MEYTPTALIIEDDEDLALIFSEALKASDFQTEVIDNGALASTALTKCTPDVVVLDMHLPHVDGVTLFEQICADERLAKTKVIVATADAQLGKELDKRANLVLLKPVDFYQLRLLASRLKP